MGGFSSLYIGVSGLRASHNAINTTSHNLVNVNTKGYVRQQVVFKDSGYNGIGAGANNSLQVGLGVDVQDIRHIRDTLLDKAYRNESGRHSFYDKQYAAINEVQEILGELDGVPFADYLVELRESVYEIEKDPSSVVARSSLIQNAVAFISRAEAIYDGLVNYQQTLNTEIVNMVNRVNEIGEEIFVLNKKILAAEAGMESANDLRDERDNLLDELSSIVQIDYTEDEKGSVRVRAENVVFVNEYSVNHMGVKMLDTQENSDYYTPVWMGLGERQVYNLEAEVSTKKGNDVGALKGLLLARGNAPADYTDIPDEEDPKYQLKDAAGNLLYNYEEDVDEYRRLVEPSTIKTVMAQFDQLIHEVVEQVNGVFCPDMSAEEAGLTGKILSVKDEAGNVIDTITLTKDMKVLNTEKAGYSACFDKDGKRMQGYELFSRKYTDRYIECTDEAGNTYKVYNDNNEFGLESLYTLGNLELNPEVLENKDLLGLTTKNGEVDQLRANDLAKAWETPYIKLGPDYVAYTDFAEYYSEYVGQIGNAGQLYENMVNYQDSLATGVDNRRMEISGVSSEEELAYLIQFQNAYNAASRYITVVDEMLEHLLTRL